METLFSFPELGNGKFYLVKSDGDLLLVLLGCHLEEGQHWCTVWTLRAALSMPSATLVVVCGEPGLPSGIPIMHTIHDPKKTVMNPHNRVGIIEYIIHYINSRLVLHGHLAEFKCLAGRVH
jgi:hypothetical protein